MIFHNKLITFSKKKSRKKHAYKFYKTKITTANEK